MICEDNWFEIEQFRFQYSHLKASTEKITMFFTVNRSAHFQSFSPTSDDSKMERIKETLQQICAILEKHPRLAGVVKRSLGELLDDIHREENPHQIGRSDDTATTKISTEQLISGRDRDHCVLLRDHNFDFSIKAMLNHQPAAVPESAKVPVPSISFRANAAVMPSGPAPASSAFPQNIATLPPLRQFQAGPWPVVVVPHVPEPGPIESSVAWTYLCSFFGTQLKFPALMRLIEEIRSVKMIPFSKNKKMRKVDLVKWLDDHWAIILPFFQSLSPEGRVRLHGYLHARL